MLALSASSSSSRSVSHHNMTLGLDRKAAISGDARASQTRQAKNPSGDAAESRPMATSLAKPKTLLSCKCTELKASGLSIIHSVQLLLTSYCDVLVLKKGDRSRNQTVLRRHSVLTDSFQEHRILTTALLVEVPQTLLRYVYQFEKEKNLRQWLDRIAACRKEHPDSRKQDAATAAGNNLFAKNGMIANHSATSLGSPLDETVQSPTWKIPKRRDAVKPKMRDFVKSSEKSPPRTCSRYRQGPGSPEPRLRVQSMTLDRGSKKLVSSTGAWEYPPAPWRACSTGSSDTSSAPSKGTQDANTGVNSADSPSRDTENVACDIACVGSKKEDTSTVHQDTSGVCSTLSSESSGVSSCRTQDSTCLGSKDILTMETTSGENGSTSLDSKVWCWDTSVVEGEGREETSICSPSMVVVTVPEGQSSPLMACSHPGQQMGRSDSRDVVEVVSHDDNAVSSAPLSPACLSRNSSARSSSKSVGVGSARSLNLAVLQESLELSCGEQSEALHYSSFGDNVGSALSCGDQNEVRQRSSSSSEHASSCGERSEAQNRSPSREHLGLNLSEKRGSFVRRASDQLAGLLKMHSFRERERRKSDYIRLSSSVSELDSMLSSDHSPDFLCPPRRPHSRSCHSPTTPTSPLMHSCVISPSTSPVFAEEVLGGGGNPEEGEIPEIGGNLEEGGIPEIGINPEEGEKLEAFVVSKFHHTQIRNLKRKQSPRIRRTISSEQGGDVVGGGGTGEGVVRKHIRSISESPSSTAALALYRRMVDR